MNTRGINPGSCSRRPGTFRTETNNHLLSPRFHLQSLQLPISSRLSVPGSTLGKYTQTKTLGARSSWLALNHGYFLGEPKKKVVCTSHLRLFPSPLSFSHLLLVPLSLYLPPLFTFIPHTIPTHHFFLGLGRNSMSLVQPF